MRLVVALGGNALLQRGEKPDAEIQEHHIAQAVDALAPLCSDHDVVLTHGNGPQVGLLALESGADPALSHAYPLDSLGAQTQGMIGYWLAQALDNAVPERTFAALVCQTVVDAEDPAFLDPSKFVGQVYSEAQATTLAATWHWAVKADGANWRRVVPSPQPQEIVELPILEHLLSNGAGVICCGGGGIPVIRDEHGLLCGVEAVVDKDRTACLLARSLGADTLLVLTDVEAIELDYGTATARSDPSSEHHRAPSAHVPRGVDGAQGRGGVRLRRHRRWVGGHRLPRGRRGHPRGVGRHDGHPRLST